MEIVAIRARERVAAAQVDAVRARRAEIAQAIAGQMDAARAVLEGALAIARNTAPALDAARISETQARARYAAGLATALDVADAERVVAQAELDDTDARLNVRRAMLLVARASGDLSPFLIEASSNPSPSPGGH
jgi:outer membrane protein TolC